MKYKIVNSTNKEEIGHVFDPIQVSPIMKVASGGIMLDFEGREFIMVEPTQAQDREHDGNPLLYGVLVILIVLGTIFFSNRNKS